MKIEDFNELPILGILRGITDKMIEPISETIIRAGLKTVEITMNTKGAGKLIQKLTEVSKKNLTIGAGTILSLDDAKKACDSGASFIVMPVIIDEVMDYCTRNKIPVFPGALTPNEIFRAWNLGATMVKVFPAKAFGFSYFKEVKAPLNKIKLLATGGVSEENIQQFFLSGADAISFGASIFNLEWMEKGEYNIIGMKIKELISHYNEMKFELL